MGENVFLLQLTVSYRRVCWCYIVTGESVLVCQESERAKATRLLSSQPLPVISCLQQTADDEPSYQLKRAILEVKTVCLHSRFLSLCLSYSLSMAEGSPDAAYLLGALIRGPVHYCTISYIVLLHAVVLVFIINN